MREAVTHRPAAQGSHDCAATACTAAEPSAPSCRPWRGVTHTGRRWSSSLPASCSIRRTCRAASCLLSLAERPAGASCTRGLTPQFEGRYTVLWKPPLTAAQLKYGCSSVDLTRNAGERERVEMGEAGASVSIRFLALCRLGQTHHSKGSSNNVIANSAGSGSSNSSSHDCAIHIQAPVRAW